MENKKNKYGPQNKYIKANTIKYAFRLNKKTDADLIEFVDGLDNKTEFFKNCIREYLKKNWKISNIFLKTLDILPPICYNISVSVRGVQKKEEVPTTKKWNHFPKTQIAYNNYLCICYHFLNNLSRGIRMYNDKYFKNIKKDSCYMLSEFWGSGFKFSRFGNLFLFLYPSYRYTYIIAY